MSYSDIKVRVVEENVLLIELTRTEARNALRNQTLAELAEVLAHHHNKPEIRCVVVTGNERVFAAGADIKEMQALDPVASLSNVRAEYWKTIRHFPQPIIAAVNGFALGGGCELMMHCDIVVAGDNALIGQPEINLGIMPGAGGTQRLIRTVGKSMAMKMILTGEPISASQALDAGLVSEVCPREMTLNRALQLAQKIAAKSPLAITLAKGTILSAFEVPLEAGLELERRAFAVLAGSEDREEGICAFLEKRQAEFKGK